LRNFLWVADFAPIPEGIHCIIAAYEDDAPAHGVAVFKPEMAGP
jgi:hypothetical protein